MIKKRIFFCIFIFLFFFVYNNTFAQETLTLTASPNIKVDHVTNGLERLAEKITYLFKFSNQQKASYQTELLEKRLAELNFVVENKELDLVEETASRYSTYLGKLTNFTVENKLADKKNELLPVYQRHSQIIRDIQKNVEVDSGWWIAIQHDINSLKIFGDQISQIK